MAVGKNERGKWTVRVKYRHPDGRVERVRETSPIQTKRGAQEHERQIRLDLQNGTWRKREDPAPDKSTKVTTTVTTLAEFEERYFELCQAVDEKPGSLESKESAFRAHLLPLFGHRRLDSFTSKDGNTLLVHFAKKAASTYNNHATVLNSVLEVAKGDGVIAEVPWQFRMRKRKKPKNDFHEPGVYEDMIAAA